MPIHEPIEGGSRRPPLISLRVSLRFLPAPPTEPTDTLVLNAGGLKSLYTDFRPLRGTPGSCDWALSGAKEDLGGGRARWTRIIDSRRAPRAPGDKGPNAPVEADEGMCERLENGDELERGEMLNPETGRIESYEEVWRDEEVPSGARVMLAVLPRSEGEGTVKGVWIRVGRWCQGVAEDDQGRVVASRWRFDEGAWAEAVTYGDASSLPVPKGCALEDTTVSWNGLSWIVEEDYKVL